MYRTVAQLDSLTQTSRHLVPGSLHPVNVFPNRPSQGRPVYALRLRAGGGTERRGVLLVGGTHARELMNPDAIIELAVDLSSAMPTAPISPTAADAGPPATSS